MKNPRKVTRVKLQIDQINDCILLGLVSSEPDYKLSLTLNKKFGISLKNISPVKLTTDNGSELLFSRFSNTSGSAERVFNLVSNRSGKHFLIRKLKNIDYIFNIHNPDNEDIINQIISRLRELAGITAVFNIDIGSIKDKNLNFVIQ
jgi:hypothetical protein